VRVLVVEDQAKLATIVAAGLRRAGMAVDVVFDGTDALEHTASTPYDVVVLDRDLPGVGGDEVCRTLAAAGSATRILMLTGARTVVARIRALGRRPGAALAPVLSHGDLRLDSARRQVTRAGRDLALNPKEFAVLEVLLAAGGTVVSSEELLERVWDSEADPFSQAVKTTMSRLRAKLGDPPVIETLTRSGYRIT
jgi:DNA-binding response OmpR family regulator